MTDDREDGLLRRIVEKTSEFIVVHRGGKILYVNPTLAGCLGFDRHDELVGRPLADILHPEDVPRENRRVRVMAATNEVAPLYNYRLVRRDADRVELFEFGLQAILLAI